MSAQSFPFDEQKLRDTFRGFSLPFCPYHLNALATEISRGSTNSRRVCEILSKDTALTALLFRLANSPAFGMCMGTASIQEAGHAVSYRPFLAMMHLELLKLPESSRFLLQYWANVVYAANLCAALAEVMDKVPRDAAYTFGMMHHCGALLLAQRFANYPEIWEAANTSPGRSFTQMEDDALATNHATISYYTARGCALPEWLTQAILHHHDYGALTGALLLPDESCSLIACAAMTDHILTERLFARQDAEWERALPAVADYLNLVPQSVEDLLEDIQVQVEAQQRQRESLQPHHGEEPPV